tara:strand:- start:6 stop:302 length:297 start_codon:yes stop_codon:yes gene_type:complete
MNKILKFIVIFLGLLIIISFIALIYGTYLKLNKKNSFEIEEISLYEKGWIQNKNDLIEEIIPINKEYILIVINKFENPEKHFLIYNFKNDKVLKYIGN